MFGAISIHPHNRKTRKERVRQARERFQGKPGQFNPDAAQNGHPKAKRLAARINDWAATKGNTINVRTVLNIRGHEHHKPGSLSK